MATTLVSFGGVLLGQEEPLIAADSLEKLSYKEIFDIYFAFDKDSIKVIPYVQEYLKRAKRDKDTLKIARAYADLGYISSPKIEIKYCDSIILYTKEIVHKTFPNYGYSVKARILSDLGHYKESLDYRFLALESAKKSGNEIRIRVSKWGIASTKALIGENEEALFIYKELLKDQSEPKTNREKINHLLLYRNIANRFTQMDKLDSSEVYSKIGMGLAKKYKDTTNYYFLYTNLGVLARKRGNYELARTILTKTIPHNTGSYKLTTYLERGNAYFEDEKIVEAIADYITADSITQEVQKYFPSHRVMYTRLSDHFKEQKDYENQLNYINKLIYADSIIDSYHNYLKENLEDKYDTPLLLSTRDEAIKNLKKKNAGFVIPLLIFSILTIVLASSSIYYFRRQRRFSKRFEALMNQPMEQLSNCKDVRSEVMDISNDKIDMIRKKLDLFEENRAYLSNSLSLHSLSKKIGTNSTYLSKVINADKKKNFSAYITDLRIEYIIEKLKIDAKLRKYNIKSIAHEIGFNNPESFSKAFYRKTGIYPSFFIKQLER